MFDPSQHFLLQSYLSYMHACDFHGIEKDCKILQGSKTFSNSKWRVKVSDIKTGSKSPRVRKEASLISIYSPKPDCVNYDLIQGNPGDWEPRENALPDPHQVIG